MGGSYKPNMEGGQGVVCVLGQVGVKGGGAGEGNRQEWWVYCGDGSRFMVGTKGGGKV